MELVVKSSNFGVMEFTVKQPHYVPKPSRVVPGNVYGVMAGVAPPEPVIQYPTTSTPVMETPATEAPGNSPSSTE